MHGTASCFCCFCSKLSAREISSSAEILDRRRFGERQNSQIAAVLPLFAAILVKNSKNSEEGISIANNSSYPSAQDPDTVKHITRTAYCQFNKCNYRTDAVGCFVVSSARRTLKLLRAKDQSRNRAASFDDLVGSREQRGRKDEVERLNWDWSFRLIGGSAHCVRAVMPQELKTTTSASSLTEEAALVVAKRLMRNLTQR